MKLAHSVERITDWFRMNAPDTALGIRGPASPSDREKLRLVLREVWIPDLEELFSVADGAASFNSVGAFLGDASPVGYWYSIAEALTERDIALAAAKKFDAESDLTEHTGPSGGRFRSEFFPLMGIDGNFYFVDLRPDVHNGRVRWWDSELGDSDDQIWASITEFFESIEGWLHLSTASPWPLPTIVNGRLLRPENVPDLDVELSPAPPSTDGELTRQLLSELDPNQRDAPIFILMPDGDLAQARLSELPEKGGLVSVGGENYVIHSVHGAGLESAFFADGVIVSLRTRDSAHLNPSSRLADELADAYERLIAVVQWSWRAWVTRSLELSLETVYGGTTEAGKARWEKIQLLIAKIQHSFSMSGPMRHVIEDKSDMTSEGILGRVDAFTRSLSEQVANELALGSIETASFLNSLGRPMRDNDLLERVSAYSVAWNRVHTSGDERSEPTSTTASS